MQNFTLHMPSQSEPKNPQIEEDSSYQSSDSGANYRVEIDSTAIRRKVENEGHEYCSDDGQREEDDFINLPLHSESYELNSNGHV